MTPLRKLLLGYDLSEGAKAAASAALELGSCFKSSIDVLTALPQGLEPEVVRELQQQGRTPAESEAEGFAQFVTVVTRDFERMPTQDLEIAFDVCEGSPARSLIERAGKGAADMIVVGAVGRGASESPQPIGTETFRLVRQSQVPVLVVGRDNTFPPRTMLVAVDMSDASLRALEIALLLASEDVSCRVIALHVVRGSSAVTSVDAFEAFMDAVETGDVVVERRVVHGRASRIIVSQASDVDLLVIGSIGRSPVVEFLIGGTAERVLRAFPCSMLLVKAPPVPDS